MDAPKKMPILHVAIGIAESGMNVEVSKNIQKIVMFLKEKYKDHYTVIVTPKDFPDIRTSDYNVAVLPIYDEDCIRNLLKILDDESWKDGNNNCVNKEESKNDSSQY